MSLCDRVPLYRYIAVLFGEKSRLQESEAVQITMGIVTAVIALMAFAFDGAFNTPKVLWRRAVIH